MGTEKLIIHRANAAPDQYPLKALTPVLAQGYRNLEIDITVTGPLSFKFCHTSQLQLAPITFRVDSSLFEWLATLDVSLWVVDMKYPFGDPPPTTLLQNIFSALGERMILAAAQPELLIAAHELGVRTAQYFRNHISGELPFVPEFFMHEEERKVDVPLNKTIVYCHTLSSARRHLAAGAPYAMVERQTIENDS